MKRVEIIHVNGITFSIDDDAYNTLSTYLKSLGDYFKNEEIIADIETRVAELFSERPGGARAIVTASDVSRVMATLGTVADIAGNAPDAGEIPPAPPRREGQAKRLYRDLDRRYLGGVCAGIACWTGVNVALLRLLFILLTLFWGLSCLVYLVLYMIIPPARSTAQKLEMRGQPVNISTIEKSVRESFTSSSIGQSLGRFTGDAGAMLGKLFGIVLRVVAVALGLFLIASGLFVLAGAGCAVFMQDLLFADEVEWSFLTFHELARHVISPVSYQLLRACGIVLTLLLSFACFFWGACLVGRFKVTRGYVHVILLLAWVGAALLAAVTSALEARHHAWKNEVQETIVRPPVDTLHLASVSSGMKLSYNPLGVYHDKESGRFLGKPDVIIRPGEAGSIKIVLVKQSFGASRLQAYHHAGEIDYRVDARDSLLLFPDFFTVAPAGQWHFQEVDVVLHVPAGTVIVDPDGLIRFGYKLWPHAPRAWVMTRERGLQRLDNRP
jgi:phage shock protein PspC (stress-responsive transcriptional regulator)